MEKWLSDTNNIYRESPWLLFNNMDWAPLIKDSIPETYQKGSFIYHQNQSSDYIYVIKSGRVNMSIVNSDGKVRTLFICGEGSIFGEISHFISPENCAQAQVVSTSVIYKVKKSRFQKLFETNSIIAQNTAIILSKKVRALTAQMESTMFPDAIKRVANILLYLAGQYGKQTENGLLLNICFSHQEVADLIGTSRVTVTNAFKQLSKCGLVKKSRGKTQIFNCEKLKEMLLW